MDFSTVISNLNWLAVIVAAVSTFVIGGIWYSPLLFQKAWMSSNNFTEESLSEGRKPGLIFGLSFVMSIIMSFNLAMFIGQESDMAFAISAATLTAIGWILPSFAIINLFEKRSMKYFLVNGGYLLVSFIVMGIILGAWK